MSSVVPSAKRKYSMRLFATAQSCSVMLSVSCRTTPGWAGSLTPTIRLLPDAETMMSDSAMPGPNTSVSEPPSAMSS